ESQGIMVKEAKNENPVAIMTVTQNCLIMFDTRSFPIEIGKNTTTITKVIAMTVNPISAAPSYAARTLFLPISMCLWMFSRTTMASSTNIPTTRERATKLIRFRVYPIKYIPIKVAISDEGIATITISAFLKLCKNNIITAATRKIAKNRSKITWLAAVRVNSLLSLAMVKLTFSAA